MHGSCERCGGPLACFEGETFCPDCCRYETEEEARQADEEARLLRLAPEPPPDEGPAGDVPPF